MQNLNLFLNFNFNLTILIIISIIIIIIYFLYLLKYTEKFNSNEKVSRVNHSALSLDKFIQVLLENDIKPHKRNITKNIQKSKARVESDISFNPIELKKLGLNQFITKLGNYEVVNTSSIVPLLYKLIKSNYDRVNKLNSSINKMKESIYNLEKKKYN